MVTKPEIKLLFFSSRVNEAYKKILESVPDFFSENQVNHYHDLDLFLDALQGELSGLCIVLIVVQDERELAALIQMRHILKDHWLILVLGSTKDVLMSQALKLYPRYTSYIKENYTDISLVLDKTVTKIQNTINVRKNDGVLTG